MASEHPSPASRAQTVEQLIRDRLTTALGGLRGSLEASLPTIVFVTVWLIGHDVRWAAGAAIVTAAAFGVVRLMRRETLQYVGASLFATLLAGFFAVRSGRAEDAFLPGILMSTGGLLLTALSVVIRWPMVGFVAAVAEPDFAQDPLGWRRDRPFVTVCQRLTLVLVAMYAVRVGIMAPLYLAGNVPALGVAKVVLGWPLYVAAIAVMIALLVRGQTPPQPKEGATDDPAAGDPAPDDLASD